MFARKLRILFTAACARRITPMSPSCSAFFKRSTACSRQGLDVARQSKPLRFRLRSRFRVSLPLQAKAVSRVPENRSPTKTKTTSHSRMLVPPFNAASTSGLERDRQILHRISVYGHQYAENGKEGSVTHITHRNRLVVTSSGQSRYSTTLFEDGGRRFRVTRRKPCGFAFQIFRYSRRTSARAGGREIGAALVLVLSVCTRPHHTDRRMFIQR
jgi:hypothetical protein